MTSTLIKLVAILIIADAVGSLLLPAKYQAHNWWLDTGRIGRVAIGIFLLLALGGLL